MDKFIICCGMQRSGSSLQYNITKEIAETTENPIVLGWCMWQDFSRVYEKHKNHDGIVIMRTHPALHVYYPQYHDLFFSRNNWKFIHCYRNILDVVASLIRFGYDRESVLASDVNGLIDTYNNWMKIPSGKMATMKYEQFYNEIYELVIHLSVFLNIRLDAHQQFEIYERNTLDGSKKKIEKSKEKFNRDTTYWHNHITNNGEVGSYKETLTKQEIGRLLDNKKIVEWMERTGYNIHVR